MTELKENQLPNTLAALPSGGGGDAILEFGGKTPRRLSFDAIIEAADKLSAGLRQRDSDDASKQPVILFAPASSEAIIAAIGILRAGRIAAPLDTQMPDDDLVHALRNSGARIALTTKGLWRRLRALENAPGLECFLLDVEADEGNENGGSGKSGAAPSWHSLCEDSGASADDPPEPESTDIALLFYTSGTTGPPKGVPLSHENIRFQMETVIRTGLIQANDRFLQPLPFHHVYPFVIGILAPLALGLPVILPGALTGKALATALKDGEATVAIGVPRLYRAFYGGLRGRMTSLPAGGALFDAALALAKTGDRIGIPLGRFLFRPIRKKAAPRLRLLASGGSRIDPALARNLEALGWPVAIGYGLTETAPLLTVKKSGVDTFDSVGRAVDGVRLRIDPDALEMNGEETPAREGGGDEGELLAKGPNVFPGYRGDDKETRKSFTGSGWFRTGDVASIDQRGAVYLNGRVSTRIALQGGENVDPAALEERYANADGVEEIGILEHDGKLAALVVPGEDLRRGNDREAVAGRIREALKKRGRALPSYQRLSQVEIRARELPRTRLGKIRRHELADAFAKARAGESDPSARKNRTGPLPEEDFTSRERALLDNSRARALWDLLCERYPDRPVAPGAELESELGVDSLEWVELSLAIETATGVSVDEATMARVERVVDLLEAIAEAEGGAGGKQASEALKNPDSTLDASELKWTQERGPVRRAVAFVLYHLVVAYLRVSLRVEPIGLRNLPEDRPHILAPNHVSHLDAPCLGAALGYGRARRAFWAGYTGVMFRNAFVREISRLAHVVPIDARRGPISSLAMAAKVLQRDRTLIWFPEGRISPDGSLRAFQPGIGLLLKHHDVPVVPIHIEGTHAALPKGKRLPRWGKVRIRFGRVIEAPELRGDAGGKQPKEVAEALREAVRELSRQAESGEDPP
ncbi:MAG: AMP-binding protein [Puniceicoccaceae bacterium]